jgi:Methylase involved in ubiquinone/menaquinone biosynthesis
MIGDLVSRWIHPARVIPKRDDSAEDIEAFIDSRALEYATKSDDAFVERALKLGVGSGMVLDVGTRAGLIVLKILWQNENLFSIGVDASSAMIDRARETAAAWGLGERAFFQVGDARRMRLKTAYFDLVVSDGVFHGFPDPVSVLSEIGRVLKPKGGLLIRDFRRPNRFKMARDIAGQTQSYGNRMRPQIEEALRAAYTPAELRQMLKASEIEGARVIELDEHHIAIEREGLTDPNSWVSVREQYR